VSLDDQFDWLDASRLLRPEQVREDLQSIWTVGATADLLHNLRDQLIDQFDQLDDVDTAVANLSRFVVNSRSPAALLSLFERDREALPSLLRVFATSQTLANRMIADPESLDLMRASGGQPAPRKYLVDELVAELRPLESASRASLAIRKFVSREMTRIAYGEFVRELSPDSVGHQLAFVADAVLEASLQFVTARLVQRHGQPQLVDGQIPQVTVIALGHLGGEEMGYGAPLDVLFMYDAIDELNPSHRQFYESLVEEIVSLLCPDESVALGIDIDFSLSKSLDRASEQSLIRSVDAVTRTLESQGLIWQRMAFVKARCAAGSNELGQRFLQRIQPWIYRHYLSSHDLIDIGALRHKLERRAESAASESGNVLTDPGGRHDIELTIQFLQLFHGGDLAEVRIANTAAAIVALERAGCVTHQEATLLVANYARLCRLQHQLSVMFGKHTGLLPADPEMQRRLAWRLGVRSDARTGDLEKFRRQLSDTFQINRKMINHLMVDVPEVSESAGADEVHGLETELILDPDPDPRLVTQTLSRHRLGDPQRAMQCLIDLSTESVSFLSPARCRHFLAAIAPALLSEVGKTPDPAATLDSLVSVADSIGGKASLWELMGANRPTMQLMVRLCAAAPYLTAILTDNPGMIDELIDSLLMNRLPSAQRLDAQSIELCRGAADIDLILHNFKNSAHLMIGVREMLGKEMIEATHASISDTAEACLRRVIDYEYDLLTEQFGDPVDQAGQPAEFVALALGKFGGREPNYHSDLDVIFLYSSRGETRRRVGGRRTTTTNQLFFNQLAQRVIERIKSPATSRPLYQLDGRLRPTGDEGLLAVPIDEFIRRFQQGVAPLWQRLALCKARSISGSRPLRKRTDQAIAEVIRETSWHPAMADEIREMRHRVQDTATEANLKRGAGGTVDVEVIAQMLIIKHAGESPEILLPGTTAALQAISAAGYLPETDSLALINGYRTLRRVEAYLRLMDTPGRHELPSSEAALQNLAFLMDEPDPAMIVAQCQQARLKNRRIFDQVFASASSTATQR
jgi:glutamate-ammonia-ligase adenylyltransferase